MHLVSTGESYRRQLESGLCKLLRLVSMTSFAAEPLIKSLVSLSHSSAGRRAPWA